jgi:hypothetical protein
MPKKIKTVKWTGRRYEVVFELDMSVCVNLHEDQIHGHVSRMLIPKQKLSPFWQRRIGIEIH